MSSPEPNAYKYPGPDPYPKPDQDPNKNIDIQKRNHINNHFHVDLNVDAHWGVAVDLNFDDDKSFFTYIGINFQLNIRGAPGIDAGTFRTQIKNQTTRPNRQLFSSAQASLLWQTNQIQKQMNHYVHVSCLCVTFDIGNACVNMLFPRWCVICVIQETLSFCISFTIDVCTQDTFVQVAMTSASHAEGRQFDPGHVYVYVSVVKV